MAKECSPCNRRAQAPARLCGGKQNQSISARSHLCRAVLLERAQHCVHAVGADDRVRIVTVQLAHDAHALHRRRRRQRVPHGVQLDESPHDVAATERAPRVRVLLVDDHELTRRELHRNGLRGEARRQVMHHLVR